MNAWIAKFLEQLDLAGVILLMMLIIMAVLFIAAQLDKDFDFRRMLLDDNEKPSVLRGITVGAWAISSWVVMRDAISVQGADPQILVIYLGFWSGTPIAAKFIEALQVKWTTPKGPLA